MVRGCKRRMWTFSRQFLSQSRIINRNLLRQNAIVGCFNTKPCFSRGKQDNTNDEPFKISRLFTPSPIEEAAKTDSVIEFTGTIKKSDIFKVINEFSQKKETRIILSNYGLDGELNSSLCANSIQ